MCLLKYKIISVDQKKENFVFTKSWLTSFYFTLLAHYLLTSKMH